MTEKQANINKPLDFSQLLGMDDRELQLEAERRRVSEAGNRLASTTPSLGGLGLDFSSENPFADPIAATTKPQSRPWAEKKNMDTDNPFADPVTRPKPSIQKPQTYINDMRRSRGQSIDNIYSSYQTGGSRYPSSIAPSRDSYRDTVISNYSNNNRISTNGRKGKGRSDPFDLERPDLWRPNVDNRASGRPRGASTGGGRDSNLYPNPLLMNSIRGTNPMGIGGGQVDSMMGPGNPQPRMVSVQSPRIVSAESYASKYSSVVSSLGDWGDPGPDLGPGSGNSSIRGNASSNGSGDFGRGYGDDGKDGGYGQDSVRRVAGSPNGKAVVGKAL